MIWLNDLKYVKVSRIEDKGNYVKATLSTSEKKQDGSYEYSNWFSTFVGKSVDKSKQLSDGDKITVVKGKLTNVYNKETKKSYTNLTVFEFLGGNENFEKYPNVKDADIDDFSFGAGSFEDFQQVEDDNDVPF